MTKSIWIQTETPKNMKTKSVKVLIGCAALAVSLMVSSPANSAPSAGAIIYDNTSTYLTNFFAAPNEFGDQVHFAGTQRQLTEVEFEYFGSLLTQGDNHASVNFRLYANAAGGSGAPTGAPLYESGAVTIFNGFNHIDITGISVTVPNTVTWTAEFSGLSVGETAGLPLYSPPTIGASLGGGVIGSFDDFWQNNGGTWQLFRFPGGDPDGNFAARFTAITAIPEASAIAYGLLGGLMFVSYRAYRRRSVAC